MTNWKLVPDWSNKAMRDALRVAAPGVSGDVLDHALYRALAAAPDPADDAELVERGGRAICEADGHDWDKLGSNDYHRMERQAIYKRQFIAVLKAIQEGR